MNHICSTLLNPDFLASSPPPGSVNVRVGRAVEGPGGKWVPCATKVAEGVYYPGLFEVGSGRRQVCFPGRPQSNVDDAFFRAVRLASTAAA